MTNTFTTERDGRRVFGVYVVDVNADGWCCFVLLSQVEEELTRATMRAKVLLQLVEERRKRSRCLPPTMTNPFRVTTQVITPRISYLVKRLDPCFPLSTATEQMLSSSTKPRRSGGKRQKLRGFNRAPRPTFSYISSLHPYVAPFVSNPSVAVITELNTILKAPARDKNAVNCQPHNKRVKT